MTAGVVFAAVFAAMFAAHEVGDHWGSSNGQARCKGLPGWAGRRACAGHVSSYTGLTAGAVLLVWALLGVPVTPVGFVVGQAVSAVSHYWADRRTTLARLAARLGKASFYALGQPRSGRDDNPTLGTGAYALDQSWHIGWLFVAAVVTAALSTGVA